MFDRLSSGGFADPDSESTRADDLLEDRFGAGAPNVVLLVTADDGDVDAPEVAAVGQQLTDELAAYPKADDVVSYWSLGSPPPLRSEDGSAAMVVGRLAGDQDDWQDAADGLADTFSGERGPVTVEVGGPVEIFNQIGETIESDLARAESVAVPITLILLIIVFGGVVAALLPVGVGMLAVLGAFFVLWLVTAVTDVSVFSINLVTAMGLGLAIDYSLFVVSRFREELHAGRSVDDAVVRTVETAGRTVAFSALTVAASLSALLIFPLFFLRSFAYAGIGVILVAMLASLVSLPALLAVLGPRVDRWRVFRHRETPGRRHGVLAPPGHRGHAPAVRGDRRRGGACWSASACPSCRRSSARRTTGCCPRATRPARCPRPCGTTSCPTRPTPSRWSPSGRWTTPTSRPTPPSCRPCPASPGSTPAPVVTPTARCSSAPTPPPSSSGATGRPGSASCPPSNPSPRRARPWSSPSGISTPPSTRSWSAGMGAQQIDVKDAIFGLVPWAALWIAVATFILLFAMFGSILVPVKALVLNTLSLTATFGAMVWIFQEGHGAGLLDFTPTGLTDTTTPILMFCIAFGLSMDYEVFLLSRIKEEYDRTGDNEHAVAAGLEHTGRIVTAAALLLAVTFLAFATSGITFIKLFGLGLAMAVVMDATIVRALLVPAFMKLAGDANWWAPGPLKRLQQRFGLHEAAPDEVDRAAAASGRGQPVGDGGQGGAVLEEERVPTVEPAEIRALDLTGERLLVGGQGDAVEAPRGDQDG